MFGENNGKTGLRREMEKFDHAVCHFCYLCHKDQQEPQGPYYFNQGYLSRGPPIIFLFLLCAEGLSALIKALVSNGQMKGLAIYHGALKLSHLFFADDSLIFCKSLIAKCDSLQITNYTKCNEK